MTKASTTPLVRFPLNDSTNKASSFFENWIKRKKETHDSEKHPKHQFPLRNMFSSLPSSLLRKRFNENKIQGKDPQGENLNDDEANDEDASSQAASMDAKERTTPEEDPDTSKDMDKDEEQNPRGSVNDEQKDVENTSFRHVDKPVLDNVDGERVRELRRKRLRMEHGEISNVSKIDKEQIALDDTQKMAISSSG